MQTNQVELYYCPHCGYFLDMKQTKIFDIAYTDMSASLAMQVMSDRQKQSRPCHMTYRNKLSKKKPVLLPE